MLPPNIIRLGSLMQSRLQSKSSTSPRFRKRSDIDIVANILNEARKGARRTRIMYRCNLSHTQLQVYLKLLLGMELLTFNPDLYKTTAKGLEFLDAYRALKALMT
jgi:predicted transcriptional regulator